MKTGLEVTVTAGPVSQTQDRTSTWTLTTGVTQVTAGGVNWKNAVEFTVESTTEQMGALVVSNDDLQVSSLDGPGIVWSQSETTTPGGTDTATTVLISVTDP